MFQTEEMESTGSGSFITLMSAYYVGHDQVTTDLYYTEPITNYAMFDSVSNFYLREYPFGDVKKGHLGKAVIYY